MISPIAMGIHGNRRVHRTRDVVGRKPVALYLGGAAVAKAADLPGLGKPISAAELALCDMSIGPDGKGLSQAFSMNTMSPMFMLHEGKRYWLRFRNATDDIHPLHLHRATTCPSRSESGFPRRGR